MHSKRHSSSRVISVRSSCTNNTKLRSTKSNQFQNIELKELLRPTESNDKTIRTKISLSSVLSQITPVLTNKLFQLQAEAHNSSILGTILWASAARDQRAVKC